MALAYLTINLDAFTGDDHPPVPSYSTITLDPGADHIDAAADVIHVRTIVVSLDRQGKAATANGVPCIDGKVPVVAGVAYAVSAPNVLRGGPHYIPALTAAQVVDLSDYITPGAPLTPDQAATLTARIVALEETPPGAGVTDHGALTGLGDDDHGLYALADGTRGAFAAPLGADDNYVTDAEKAALHAHSNKAALDLVSGTNTGDQVLPTWSTISGKPAVVAEGATQAAARTAIGAGTSSFSGAYADLSGKPTLGDAAAKNTGTTAGTVAAGDDSRIGKIGGTVTVSGTPTAGQVPIASSGTAAAWGTPSGGGGGSNWSYVPTIPYVGRWYTSSSAGLSGNRGVPAEATLVPFLCPFNFTADRIGIGVSTAEPTTNVRLGIYNSRTDGMPGTVLLDAGTVGVATLGEQSIVISQTLTKGTLYWLVATATVNNSSARGYGISSNAQYGGSPDLGRSSLTSGYAADGIYMPRSGGVGDGSALVDLTSRNDYVFAGGYTMPFLRVGSV